VNVVSAHLQDRAPGLPSCMSARTVWCRGSQAEASSGSKEGAKGRSGRVTTLHCHSSLTEEVEE
jgi:hypothetical protein